MNLKIDRDEEKCLECMFLTGDMFNFQGECLLFKRSLDAEINWADRVVEYFKPCRECEQLWWKDK